MAIVCPDYNLLFIMTPRTACTAIGQLLCDHYGGEFLPSEDVLDAHGNISIQKKHTTLAELIGHGFIGTEKAKSMLKIAAVRNPFDTLVSLYFKQRFKYVPLLSDPGSWVNRMPHYARNMKFAQAHSFGAWIFRGCYKKLIKRMYGSRPSMFDDYTKDADVILRYESIEEELRDAFNQRGIPWKADIPKINRTDEREIRDYRTCYSNLTMTLVRLAYASDLENYGYSF